MKAEEKINIGRLCKNYCTEDNLQFNIVKTDILRKHTNNIPEPSYLLIKKNKYKIKLNIK